MASYRLLTYVAKDGPRAGILLGDQIYDAAALTSEPRYVTVAGILDDWERADKMLSRHDRGLPEGRPLAQTTLRAPVIDTRALFCAGANYSDHVEEMARALNLTPEPEPHSAGLKPWHFIKTYHTVRGPGEEVRLPQFAKNIDWEVELAAVIGRVARNVSIERALDYVAGYTTGLDLSARDAGKRPQVPAGSPFQYDWVSHKSFDGACPLGPWITPAREIADPQALDIKLWVNGVLKQDSNTRHMIFTIAEQIAQLSTRVALQPGDVVLTGTPAGVGAARGEFLKAGDVVRVYAEGVGEFSTPLT